MPWPYSMLIVEATGDTLSATDYNNEHQNHINNNIPTSINDISATSTDAQVQADPFPGGGLSLATDLAGEITRLRYAIANAKGTTYWYQPSTVSLAQMLPLAGGTMSGNIAMGGQKVTGLGAGTTSGDALMYGQTLNGSFADGSASAPSIVLANQSGTGIFNNTPAFSVAAASWNTSTHLITVSSAANLITGMAVQLTTSGGLPAGLSLATTYYLIIKSTTTFGLATTYANSLTDTRIAFSTQGTGTHTVTPTAAASLGVAIGGALKAVFSADGRMCIGGNLDGTANLAETLNVQGNTTPQATGGLGSIDILCQQLGTTATRIIAGNSGANPGVFTYMAASGTADTGTYWSGGPATDSTNYMQFQNGKSTVFDFFGSGSLNQNVYFWIESDPAYAHFNFGASGQEGLTVYKSGILPYQASADPSNVNEGTLYYNTTSHVYKYYNGSVWKTIATV